MRSRSIASARSVTVDQGSLTLAGVPFSQIVPTRLRMADGRAAIDDFRWTSQGNELMVTGGVDLRSDPPQLDLRAKGLMDLRMVAAFVLDMARAGIATTDLAVTSDR